MPNKINEESKGNKENNKYKKIEKKKMNKLLLTEINNTFVNSIINYAALLVYVK